MKAKPPKTPKPTVPQPAPQRPEPAVRLSFRALGVVLAGVPWVMVPAGFSRDLLDESKSLAAAAGVTLFLALAWRESRRTAGEGSETRALLNDPFRAGAALAIVGILLSALASPVPGLGLAAGLRTGLFVAFAFCLSLRCPAESELRWVLYCLFAVMGLQAVLALGQYFTPALVREFTPYDPGPVAGRSAIVGSIGNPEYLAGWMAAGLAAAAMLVWRGGGQGRGLRDPLVIFAAVTFFLTFTVIFLSGGRGAVLSAGGALAVGGVVAWRGRSTAAHSHPAAPSARRRFLIIGLAAACVLVALGIFVAIRRPDLRRGTLPTRLLETFNMRSPSMRHRLGLFCVTGRIIAEHPLLGVGPDRFGWAFGETQARLAREEHGIGFWALGEVLTGNYAGEAHCDPLQWWAEFGVLAPLGLTLMLAGALAGGAWMLRRGGEGWPVGAALWVAVAAFAINIWVAFPLQRPVRSLTFWALLGLLAAAQRRVSTDDEKMT